MISSSTTTPYRLYDDLRSMSMRCLSINRMLTLRYLLRHIWRDSVCFSFETIRLLNEETLIQITMKHFKALLCERFLFKIVEMISIFFDVKLFELRQRSDELLITYFKRVINLMQRIDVKNRFIMSRSSLILLKSTMLNINLKTFIRGLTNNEIKKKITRDMISSTRSLQIINQLTKKIKRTNIEVQKLFEKKIKQNELIFYKQLAQRNISKHQIETLLIFYHVEKHVKHNQQ